MGRCHSRSLKFVESKLPSSCNKHPTMKVNENKGGALCLTILFTTLISLINQPVVGTPLPSLGSMGEERSIEINAIPSSQDDESSILEMLLTNKTPLSSLFFNKGGHAGFNFDSLPFGEQIQKALADAVANAKDPSGKHFLSEALFRLLRMQKMENPFDYDIRTRMRPGYLLNSYRFGKRSDYTSDSPSPSSVIPDA